MAMTAHTARAPAHDSIDQGALRRCSGLRQTLSPRTRVPVLFVCQLNQTRLGGCLPCHISPPGPTLRAAHEDDTVWQRSQLAVALLPFPRRACCTWAHRLGPPV